MFIQVGAQVIGNDAAITFCVASGNFELNTAMPLIGYGLLQSIELLANGAREFNERCVQGLEADAARCQQGLERNLTLVTALVPQVGYDKAARIAKTAYETNRSIREVAEEMGGIDTTAMDRMLNP
jgi:fumarate hydratase class II